MTTSRTIGKAAVLSQVVAAGLLVTACAAPSFAGKFEQNHPRRAEVLHRDNHLNNRVNKDYGKLDGHYAQLEHQDNRIRRQEQHDARTDGGHITRGEQHQLNKEENHINKEIKHDKT